jgi:hypothetical protein
MVMLAKIPPYWIASFAALRARSGLIPFSAPVGAGGKIFGPCDPCSDSLQDLQAAGLKSVWSAAAFGCEPQFTVY